MTILQIVSNSTPRPSLKPQRKTSYFSRHELQRILNLYASRVITGEWRDYSLDHLERQAFFSIYRSSHETPLYTIEKCRLKSQWLFRLYNRYQLIKTAPQLQDVLDALKAQTKTTKN